MPASKEVVVCSRGDLHVEVYEYDEEIKLAEGQNPIVAHITSFQVLKQVLEAKSKLFKIWLGWEGRWSEAGLKTVTVHHDNVTAMEVLFRSMHDAMTETVEKVEMEVIWHLVAAADKYFVDITPLSYWFARWHARFIRTLPLNFEKYTKLLFPTWRFDHAAAFSEATKFLAYESVYHVTESNPTKYGDLHLPPRVIRESIVLDSV